MGKIFITGSADGLGHLAAKRLVSMGHEVVLHARNEKRAAEASGKVPGATTALSADLSSIAETKALADQVNALGHFDAVIHNAGVYNISPTAMNEEGLPLMFTINSLAPYILTCLINAPKRLVFMSSGMHRQGDASLKHLDDLIKKDNTRITYSDTKLHDVMLAMAISRRWTNVFSNAVDPGWVPTKMGGKGAPDSLEKGYETQVWLATGEDELANVSGKYFHHKREDRFLPAAADRNAQDKLLEAFAKLTGVSMQTK
jgi:NAD(P)-dependent dehydrogenase (short-subunit alcohol dehydrogenase family)